MYYKMELLFWSIATAIMTASGRQYVRICGHFEFDILSVISWFIFMTSTAYVEFRQSRSYFALNKISSFLRVHRIIDSDKQGELASF